MTGKKVKITFCDSKSCNSKSISTYFEPDTKAHTIDEDLQFRSGCNFGSFLLGISFPRLVLLLVTSAGFISLLSVALL